MSKWQRFWKQAQLTIGFTVMVFVIILVAIFITFTMIFLLAKLGVIGYYEENRVPLLFFAIISLIVGTVISLIVSKVPLRPIRKVMKAVDQVADGDYTVRLDLNGPQEVRELCDKFNHMAKELQSVELLRSDFVGNFSHEFKTPIVSIRGFARALKWEDLSDTERNEYLDIIISESERLSELSTNVLSLSKLEQQTILTGKKQCNISEEIRLSIAMLEQKWADKNISFRFDTNEVSLLGSDELLRQVWINLLDNAIKFSPEGGEICIDIQSSQESQVVSISNPSPPMTDETLTHLFDKFYQGDHSHATRGNGLGLAIAKRIIELHGGNVSAHYISGKAVFTVTFFVE
ncbi:sensor histidine kinase [Lachnospiraceae bacterium TWA4]|nr:sensor histidine kinase [Lachnospiraceae bacterium TWA4]